MFGPTKRVTCKSFKTLFDDVNHGRTKYPFATPGDSLHIEPTSTTTTMEKSSSSINDHNNKRITKRLRPPPPVEAYHCTSTIFYHDSDNDDMQH